MKIIQLTQGKVALVSDCDYSWISKYKWHAANVASSKKNISPQWYAARKKQYDKKKNTTIYMHKEIADRLGLFKIDHINGNGLDNRRENLRTASCRKNRQNSAIGLDNSSGFKGVSWNNERKKWIVFICVNGINTNLGRYDNKIKAALIYDAAARKHFGEFASVNFPWPGERCCRKIVNNDIKTNLKITLEGKYIIMTSNRMPEATVNV